MGGVATQVDLEALVYIPETAPPPAGHPVLLYLHGRGERATLDDVGSFGPPMLARTTERFEWAVVAPRCPPGRGWESADVLALLDAALDSLPIDPDRAVITGVSMGGFGTWAAVMSHPERFAAAVPVCGGAPFAVPSLIAPDTLEELRAVPIWAFHGADDTVVPASESADITDALRTLGCDVRLSVLTGVGHDAWTPAYADADLWAWLRQQRRHRGRR